MAIREADSTDVLDFVMACDDNSTWRGFHEKLINVVRQYRVLYDVTLKDFNNVIFYEGQCLGAGLTQAWSYFAQRS